MLDLVSFVGVDEHTNLDDLIAFDEKYGQDEVGIEYGFLFSVERSQTADKRYPSLAFIGESVDRLSGSVATSVHLCGADAIKMYLDGDQNLLDLCMNSRIQLNFKMADYDEDELLEKLITRSKDHNAPLILQSNKSKKNFIDRLLEKANLSFFDDESDLNINVLYDGSGGFGREIENVESVFPFFFTGYAGGLKPSNIFKVLELIESVNHFVTPYYIDMESGVREDDIFSLSKCEAVMEEVLAFQKAKGYV